MKRIATIAAGMAWAGVVAALAAVPAAATGVQTVYAFDAARDGSMPYNLIAAPDNRVFGLLNSGPMSGRATVFELDPPTTDATTWTERAIFTPPAKYGFLTKVLLDRSGNLFATATNYFGNGEWAGSLWQLTPSASAANGWTATLRASNPTAGGLRIAPFFLFYVNSTDVLYGGGYQYSPTANPNNTGEIIQLAPYSADPSRDLSSILAPSCTAADDPNADCSTIRSLVLGADHSFYGNTEAELFRLIPPTIPGGAWTRQTLNTAGKLRLPDDCPDADYNIGAADRAETLYAYGNCGFGFVAKFSPPTWAASTLADFASVSQAASGLVSAGNGLLLATTYSAISPKTDLGTVYRLWSQAPSQLTPIHQFSGSDGSSPMSLTTSIHADGSRAFFGSTAYGGTGWTGAAYSGAGTVFQVVP